MALPRNPRRHIVLPDNLSSTQRYQGGGNGPRIVVPPQLRAAHAAELRAGLASVETRFEAIKPAMEEAGGDRGFGIAVRFTSFPDVGLAIDSFDQTSQGIELLSVREVGDVTIAAVWIPEGKLDVFERKIAAYLERR